MMRVCDSCRSVPGAVYCQADAAVLCAACDAEVHSANLISHRHHRVPVIGIPEGVDEDGSKYKYKYKYNEDVGISSYAGLFGEEVDEYLDLADFNSADADEMEMKLKPGMMMSMSFQCSVKSEVSEVGVVPVQEQEERKDYELEFGCPASLRHGPWKQSVSSPDTTLTGVSNHPHIRPSKGTIELFSGPPIQVPTQFSPMDREARVLRYREKKKMRKFEKTIRYASRKAYAEVRPRIKGRFAKRSEVELEVDQMFSNYIVPEDSYGIVPSFQNW